MDSVNSFRVNWLRLSAFPLVLGETLQLLSLWMTKMIVTTWHCTGDSVG